MQTLQQWADANNKPLHIQPSGAAWVADGYISDDAYRALWSLSDYAVTGVTGGSVWLMKRSTTKASA